jgi:uncharacterized membrane protein
MHSYKVINVSIFSYILNMAAADTGQLLLLHILIMGIISLFFLFTVASSILLIMILIASEISGEFAANSMWLATILASIVTVIFLQKVIGRLYDRLYCVIVHFPNDNHIQNER